MNRYGKFFAIVFLAALLTVLIAPMVQAGPPPPELVKKLDKKGGDEGDGGDEGGGGDDGGTGSAGQEDALDWSGYDEGPVPAQSPTGSSSYNGTEDWGQLWPPDIGAPLRWIGQNLNPGKWVVDSLQGGLVVLGKSVLTTETWIVLFFMGQGVTVTNTYNDQINWDGSSGPPPESAPLAVPSFQDLDGWDGTGDYVGRNVLVFTPAQMTWRNEAVEGLWRNVVMLAVAVLMVMMGYGGLRVMLGGGAPGKMSGGEFLTKALAAGMLTVVTLPVFGLAIKIGNLLSLALSPKPNDVLVFSEMLQAAQEAPAVLEGIVAMSTFMLVMIVVVGIMVLRLGLLCFVIITAPLALLLWIFPGSRHWWERWSRLAWGTLILQAVLMLVLRVGMLLMNLPLTLVWGSGGGGEPDAIRTMIEGGVGSSAYPHFIILIAEPLIGIVMLILCFTLTGALLGGGGVVNSMTGAGQQPSGPGALVTRLLGGGKKEAAEGAATPAAAAPPSPSVAAAPAGGEVAVASGGAGYWSTASVGGLDMGAGSAVAGGQLDAGPPQMPRSAAAQAAPASRQELGTEVMAIGTDTATMTASGMPWQAAAGLAAAKRAETVGPMVGLDDGTSRQIGTTARTVAGMVSPATGGAGPTAGGAGPLSATGPSAAAPVAPAGKPSAAAPVAPAGVAAGPPTGAPVAPADVASTESPPSQPASIVPPAAMPPAPGATVTKTAPPEVAPSAPASTPTLTPAEEPPAGKPLPAAPRRRRRTAPPSAEEASPAEAPEKGE